MPQPRLVMVCLLSAALTACGATHRSAQHHRTPGPQPAPSTTAKRRYLAHFDGSCARGSASTTALTRTVRTLTGRIARGDARAVRTLGAVLIHVATRYRRTLAQTRRLGPPPPPDSRDGAAYLQAAQRVADAMARLGSQLAAGRTAGLPAANTAIATATAEARTAGRRYGFPTCASASRDSSGGELGNLRA